MSEHTVKWLWLEVKVTLNEDSYATWRDPEVHEEISFKVPFDMATIDTKKLPGLVNTMIDVLPGRFELEKEKYLLQKAEEEAAKAAEEAEAERAAEEEAAKAAEEAEAE